jgi:hypothetical protein
LAEKSPTPFAVAVAAGGPEQDPFRYNETVELGSAVPLISGEVLFDGDGGDAPVMTGGGGAVVSMVKTVGEFALWVPTPTTINPVVAPTGTTASTSPSLIKVKVAG